MSYFLLALLWIIWCFIHSILITPWFAEMAGRLLGRWNRYYRLGHNFIALCSLAVPVCYGWSLHGAAVFHWSGMFLLIQAALFAAALFFFIGGMLQYDLAVFMGTAQIRTQESKVTLSGKETFTMQGVHRLCRHPWYLGGICLVWSYQFSFDIASVVTSIILTCYFIIGAYLEERKLLAKFGREYKQYQQEVSMLLPWKWVRTWF